MFVFILFTGERMAVEYLLAQTNRGDLLAPLKVPEIPSACFFFFLSLTTIQTNQCGSRSILRWEVVDALAAYLLDLNRTITALSIKEEAAIVQRSSLCHGQGTFKVQNSNYFVHYN